MHESSINFDVEVDVLYRIFMNNINEFKEDFVSKAQIHNSFTVDDITFESMQIGSVKIKGSIANAD